MNQKELANRLRQNPDALQSVLRSPDGQRLLQLLSGSDGGQTLQQAAQQAESGSTAQLVQLLRRVMSTPDGAALAVLIMQQLQQFAEGEGAGMSQLDEKLNQLLGDPAAMAQVMQLAQQLSGTLGEGGGGGSPPPSPPPAPAPPPEPAAPPPGTNPLGALDPQLLTRMLPLMQSLTQTSGPTQQLLTALRPFLREEKQEKLQRAAQLAKLIHLGKQFLTEWGGGLV